MNYAESKRLQEQEFNFLDTKDLRPLLTEGRTVSDIADAISELYNSEYTEEDCVLNVIDNNELAEYLENRYGIKFIKRVELVLHGKAFNVNNFKRKIRFICGTREYSYIEDFTEYLKTLVKCNNEYTDTHEPMTMKNCYRYIQPCSIDAKDIDKYNGVHAAYGVLETFSQSYDGCVWFNSCNKDDELLIVFEETD